MTNDRKLLLLCLGVLAILFALQFVLSSYLVLALTRILILSVFAMGYNILMGYTGLLSLGHAMFFAAGLYASGLASYYWGVPLGWAFLIGIAGSAVVSVIIGLLALRTEAVAFMIVTLMFSQAAFLATLHFSKITGGDQGLTLPTEARSFDLFGLVLDMTHDGTRFNIAFTVFAVVLLLTYVATRGPFGRQLVAVRGNPGRTEMLGFNIYIVKLMAFTLSGTIAGTAGALYGLMFGYIGSSFADFQNSIQPLLFTLVGGPGTLLGPLLGTALMTMLIDRLSGLTTAYLIVVGVLLIVMTLWAPKGILGTIRDKWARWLN
ncbi:branched-chain amino acid ABC transporter permease [Chachezhania antarctica]|uniref:branched-chain amino acid ABC transporter permease n=1 Tax=Chachezhania antarctica TaxID=2340860 RepID=UPI000EAF23CE|nr:branched-chain amino acid ABC transporter permease [Chachezhania antarctica]|tara:strand:- start:7 stop:963 length:957 start_codon:yes stop_codon:yes gene_type:complete